MAEAPGDGTSSMAPADASAIDDLYALPHDGFVAARDALAKALRAAGQREDAARVRQLRRPGVAAWALNQVARRDTEAVAALVAAGAELQAAQEGAITSGAGAPLRQALERRRTLTRQLTDAARDVLVEAGRAPDGYRDEIASTLDAASLDAELGAELAAGRLTQTADGSAGFDAFAASAALAPDAAPRERPLRLVKGSAKAKGTSTPGHRAGHDLRGVGKDVESTSNRRRGSDQGGEPDSADDAAAEAEAEAAAAAERQQAEAELAEATEAAETARAAADAARSEVDDLRAEVDRLRAALKSATTQLTKAEGRSERAGRMADGAAAAQEAAQQQLDDLDS